MARKADPPPPWKPDLDPREWIRSVRHALKLSQTAFGELVGTGGQEGSTRDAVAKWDGGVEPSFTYTRRIVTVAPAELAKLFLGRSTAFAAMSDPDHTVPAPTNAGETVQHERESEYIAGILDDIHDTPLRQAAAEACSKAIRETLNPSEPAGERKRHPGRHS